MYVLHAAIVVFIGSLSFTTVHAQVCVGGELRGGYVRDDRLIMPGLALLATGELSKRLDWKAEGSWYVPRSGAISWEGGPRQLAASPDTNLRTVNGRYREGMMGVAFGVQGRYTRRASEQGMDWETVMALDDHTYWSSGTIRYVHTGEMREWRDRTHRNMLGLRFGAGYRVPIGGALLRFGVIAKLFEWEFVKYSSDRFHSLPLVGAVASYQWSVSR